MLIRRCAWHRQYNGYPIFYGVAGWRQRGVQYTDGMCRRCAGAALREWSTGRETALPPRRMAVRLRTSAARAGIAVAAVLFVVGVIALARRDGGRNKASAASTRGDRRYEWDGPAVSSARTGVAPRRKSKSQPSLACRT